MGKSLKDLSPLPYKLLSNFLFFFFFFKFVFFVSRWKDKMDYKLAKLFIECMIECIG